MTPREIEVLRHVAAGRSSAEIGALSSISGRTVETHRKNMMEELGIRSIVGLTKLAIRHGLAGLDD